MLLSDTVGFIRDLPHHLIASFRATLEEATHADCLIVVVDAADPAAQMQYATVLETLEELFIETREAAESEGIPWNKPEIVVVLNKADRLCDRSTLLAWAREVPGSIPLCALSPQGEGVAELTARILEVSRGPVREVMLTIPMADSKAIDTIEKQAKVLDRSYDGGTVTLRVIIGQRQIDRLRTGGARITVGEATGAAAE